MHIKRLATVKTQLNSLNKLIVSIRSETTTDRIFNRTSHIIEERY